jgi:hypothetical protein
MPAPTRAQARGAVIGAIILTSFGAAWAFGAILNRPSLPQYAMFVAVVPSIVLGILSVLRLVGIRGLQPAADPELAAREGRAAGRTFGIVFGIEVVVIGVVATTLARIGRPLLIPVCIVAIVGAHFLPLAKTFHIPIYTRAGWALMICALGSMLIPDEAYRDFVLGLAAAVLLWGTAAIVLVRYTGWGS